MNVIKDNKLISMSYEDVCADLGYMPEAKFVKVTNRGTITFTVGRTREIKRLYRNVIDKKYKPTKEFVGVLHKI